MHAVLTEVESFPQALWDETIGGEAKANLLSLAAAIGLLLVVLKTLCSLGASKPQGFLVHFLISVPILCSRYIGNSFHLMALFLL